MLRFSNVTETYLGEILPDKLRLDLLHIRNRSLLLDIDILVQTMLVLIPRFRRAAPRVEDVLRWPFRLARQYLTWFAIDAAIALLSISLVGVLWRSAGPIDVGLGRSLIAALFMTALFSFTNWLTGVQRIQWRFARPTEAIDVVSSASVATVIVLIVNSQAPPPRFPSEMLLVSGVFALCGFLAARFHRHLLQGLRGRLQGIGSAAAAGRERVLIVGGGDVGQLTILLIRSNPAGRAFHVVGVVDDDLKLLGNLVHRVPVLGVCDGIPEIVREHDVDAIVFAIHSIEDSRREYIQRLCRETGVRTTIMPDLLSNLRGSTPAIDDDHAMQALIEKLPQGIALPEDGSGSIRQQIHLLAEQAREGDFASVSKALGELDRALNDQESITSAVSPQRLQDAPKPSDQPSL